MKMNIGLLFLFACCQAISFGQNAHPAPTANPPASSTGYPSPVEGEYSLENFRFESGESLPQLIIHYTTVGHPVKDKSGKTLNAVLIMHGTTGDGHQFLSAQFAGGLFGPGQI